MLKFKMEISVIHYVIPLLLSATLFFTSAKLPAEVLTQETLKQPQEYLVEWAKDHLPQTGVLTEEKGGFIYLKVDDDYINQLYPRLNLTEYSKPEYFRRFDSPGAHISVFYVKERHHNEKIKEMGQEYTFKITGVAFVPPKTREYLVLTVESPDLEQLRKDYGLSPLLQGHPFHITIAKKKRSYHH